MSQHSQTRRYPRAASGVELRFAGRDIRESTLEYLDGVARNVSLGGMFIATDHPLAKGKLVKIEFTINHPEGESEVVTAKGIVRWRKRLLSPKGMGVEFIEFEGLGHRRLQDWLDDILEKD